MELIETLSRKQKGRISPTSKKKKKKWVGWPKIELWNLADMIWSLGEAVD